MGLSQADARGMSVRAWDGAKVYRDPASNPDVLKQECDGVWIGQDDETLRIVFAIASKGGGRTTVVVAMDRGALLAELEEAGWIWPSS